MPDSYAQMICGPPGSGKTPSFHTWSNFYLRNGLPVVLFAFDDFPSNLRHSFADHYYGKLAEYEKAELVTFVDCYSSIADVPSPEKYALRARVDINELSLLISDLLNERSKLGKTKKSLLALSTWSGGGCPFQNGQKEVLLETHSGSARKLHRRGETIARVGRVSRVYRHDDEPNCRLIEEV